MALDANQLAIDMRDQMGFTDPVTTKLQDMATAIVDHVKSAAVSNATGTITGTCPPSGGPLQNGEATNGVITVSSTALESDFVSAFGEDTSEVRGMAQAISTHIAAGVVEFAIGQITGVCTNTTNSPGPLTGGAGSLGTVALPSDSVLATQISTNIGQGGAVTTELSGMAAAITTHINNNAEASYASGSVTGTCPAGGGPLQGGTGSGGTIA